jgi:heme exporter protein CcmD
VSYVIAGYAVAFATLSGYAGWVLRRRRRLERFFAGPSNPAAGR